MVPGPWRAPRKQAISVTVQSTNKKKPMREIKKKQPHINERPLLIGRKWEKSKMLYIRNIDRGERDDDEIAKDIVHYGQEIGIRIMSTYIIHNKWVNDVIGCKIKIPQSQIDEALDSHNWPDSVQNAESGNI